MSLVALSQEGASSSRAPSVTPVPPDAAGPDSEPFANASATAPRSAARMHAKYGILSKDTIEAWLQRLCRDLPMLQPVQLSRPTVAQGSGRVQLVAPQVVLPNRSELLLSERAMFQEGLTYEEFVAVVGVQLLISTSVFGSRVALKKGKVMIAKVSRRVAAAGPLLAISRERLIHVLLACEVRTPHCRRQVQHSSLVGPIFWIWHPTNRNLCGPAGHPCHQLACSAWEWCGFMRHTVVRVWCEGIQAHSVAQLLVPAGTITRAAVEIIVQRVLSNKGLAVDLNPTGDFGRAILAQHLDAAHVRPPSLLAAACFIDATAPCFYRRCMQMLATIMAAMCICVRLRHVTC
jgi:hypothetical protein